MIPLLSGLLFGLVCGVISGLIPGIHSNTMAGIMAGLSPVLIPVIGAEGVVVALISMLIGHSFLDLIPSTFFGIPDSGTALSTLPAHALTLEGKGGRSGQAFCSWMYLWYNYRSTSCNNGIFSPDSHPIVY